MSRIYLSPPDIRTGDYTALDAVLDSNWVAPAGPCLTRFEETLAKQVGLGSMFEHMFSQIFEDLLGDNTRTATNSPTKAIEQMRRVVCQLRRAAIPSSNSIRTRFVLHRHTKSTILIRFKNNK